MVPEADPRSLATRLLSEHRVHIARGVSHQMCELVPRYREINEGERERSIAEVLRALERLMRGEGAQEVLLAVDQLFERRAGDGFSPSDLLLATHAYLPVIRRVFCERTGDLRAALRAYEEVEADVMPILKHVIEFAMESRQQTDPGFRQRPRATQSGEVALPALAEPDDDEATLS